MKRRSDPPSDRRAGSALAEAVGLLAKRPLSRHEVRERLTRRGWSEDEIEAALDRLEAQGIVDDAELARHWIEVRARRRGHGPARLARELEGRGIGAATVRDVLDAMIGEGDLEPRAVLEREAAKRVRGLRGRTDRAAYARVYNALLRAGHDASAIREVLDAHFHGSDSVHEDGGDAPEA